MGEKVYVSSGPPRDPEPPRASREPLNYASSAVPPRYVELLQGWIRRAGGWPQLVFAFGLAFVLMGIAAGLSTQYTQGPPAFFAFVGGLMVGIVLRVPLRRDF